METIKNMFRLDGKIALITGSASGIGKSCAKALAMAGANVVLADINLEELRSVSEEIQNLYQQMGLSLYCKYKMCDVSNLEQVELLLDEIKKLGGIDILVHSAAITNRKKLLDMNLEEWNRIIHVNLDGAYYLGRSVGMQMIEMGKSGAMTFFVSTGAFRAGVNFGAYSASKAGVVMMMKTLALELAPYGIRVNAIAPTATETRFTESYYRDNPEIKERVKNNHPLGRLGKAEDYIGTVLYLSSQASNFVTGTVVVVDGGKTAK